MRTPDPDINGWYGSAVSARHTAVYLLIRNYILWPDERTQARERFVTQPALNPVRFSLFTQEEQQHLGQKPWGSALLQLIQRDPTAIAGALYQITDGTTPLDTAMAQYQDQQRTHKIWHGVLLGLTLLAGYGGLIGLEVYVYYINIPPAIEATSMIGPIQEQITQGIRDGTLSRLEEYQLKLMIEDISLQNGTFGVHFTLSTLAIIGGMALLWMVIFPAESLRDKADSKALKGIVESLTTTMLAKPELRLALCSGQEGIGKINLNEIHSMDPAQLGNAVTAVKLALYKEINAQNKERTT